MVSSIHDYITRNDESQVKHWLSNTGDTDELDGQSRTPIFMTVQTGNVAFAKLILKKGCNVNICNKDGLYPLHLAIYNKNSKLVELLLSNKADPNKRNPGGLNAISLLCSLGSSDSSQTKLLNSLLKAGGKINITNVSGDTAIHFAAKNGCDELVQTLISNKANVDQLNEDGENALHCAVSSGKEEVVSRLLKLVGKLTVKNKEGKTALDIARDLHPKLVDMIEAAKFQRVPWKDIKPEGKWPIPRCSYSASEYNNRWYIYGGENDFDNSNTVYDDMHFYHGDSKEWRLLAPRGKVKPPALCRHTSLIFGSRLYLFGGTNLEKTFNDIWILDLDQMQWKQEKTEGPYLIRPRAGHTMTKISDTKFVVIGGSCSGDYFCDIHVFDIETRIWERIKTPSIPLTKRHLHTAIFCDQSIFVFGGCNEDTYFKDVMMLELENWNWYELEVSGIIPLPRCGHVALLVNNCVILYYGGKDSDGEILADIRSFDTRTYTWIKYDSSSSKERQPLHRAGHQMEIIGTSIITFGGNSVFCMHELLPHILDNQALSIPDEPVEEKKVIIKPPIPEKPVLVSTATTPMNKEQIEKLQNMLTELISLVGDEKFPPSHPIMQKIAQIEKFINSIANKDSKPPLPSKPNVPDKPTPPPKKPSMESNFMKKRPVSRQLSFPSIVLEELTDTLVDSGKASPDIRRRPKPAIPTPASPRELPPSPLSQSLPELPKKEASSPASPRNRGRASPRGFTRPTPRGSPRGTSRGSSRGRGAAPQPPARRGGSNVRPPRPSREEPTGNRRSIARAPTRPNRAQSDAPTLTNTGSLQTLRAPLRSRGELPSLMIRSEEEYDNMDKIDEDEDELGIQKFAHTQPTQYMLPPPPTNPLQHYQEIMAQIPNRKKVDHTEFKDKKEKQLYEITNELLTTEESYVKDLAVLIGLFKKPLEHEYEGCIPSHYIEVIFSNAESLFDLHLALFKDLLDVEIKGHGVGMAFMKVINLFPQYNSYCTNQINAGETVQKLLKTNSSFVDFTKLMEAMGECNRQDIHSYLIKPFQRITRYPLLLKELLKQTTKGTNDYHHLEGSIARIDAIVKDANEEKRLNDTVIKLIEIQKAFEWQGQEGQLRFSADCKFILEGKFKELDPKTQKIAKRHFFLFSDMVVIAKEMGKKYKKLATIPLDSCIIWDIKQGSSELPKNIKFAFSVVRTDKNTDAGRLIMCAKTSTDKENWINAINSAIALYMTPELK